MAPKNTHKCAARDCPAQVRAGMLMCGACWRLVPRAIQHEVYRTWDAYQVNAGDPAVTKAYQTACGKAVAAVVAAKAAKAGA